MKTGSGASILLFTNEKKILLQHRTADAPSNPNKWCCFGGGIEEGESPLQAVTRECIEELEYKLADPKELSTKKYTSANGTEMTVHFFWEEYDATQPLVLHEGQGYDWFTLEDALKLDLTQGTSLLLEELNEKNPLF